MKNSLLTLIIVLSSSVFTWVQAQQKTLDCIFLNNGNTIPTRIIRVNNNAIFYTDTVSFQITEISRDLVRDYEFNDGFFITNQYGEMEHSEVIVVEGFSKNEIYRAINPVNSFEQLGPVHRLAIFTVV
jgi:hypothetical protein